MINLIYLLYFLFVFCLIYKNSFFLLLIVVMIDKFNFKNFLYRFLLILFLFLLGEVVLIYNSCLLDFEMVQSMFGTKSLMKVRNYSDTLYYIKNTELGLKTGLENGNIPLTNHWIGRPLEVPEKDFTFEMYNNFKNLSLKFNRCKPNLDDFNFDKSIKHYMDLNFSLNELDNLSVEIRKYTKSKFVACNNISTLEFSNKPLNGSSRGRQYITTTPIRLDLNPAISLIDNFKPFFGNYFRLVDLKNVSNIKNLDLFLESHLAYRSQIINLETNVIVMHIVNNELFVNIETPEGIKLPFKCAGDHHYSTSYIQKLIEKCKK